MYICKLTMFYGSRSANKSILSYLITPSPSRDPAASPKAPTLPLLYGGGDTFSLGGLPSGGWRAACVLYGGGCAVLAVTAVCAVLAQCLPGHVSHRIAAVVGGAQGIAGEGGFVHFRF
jgi:hypothetical protein